MRRYLPGRFIVFPNSRAALLLYIIVPTYIYYMYIVYTSYNDFRIYCRPMSSKT